MSDLVTPKSILKGNRKIPGCDLPPDVKAKLPEIFEACYKLGLDPYPVIIEDIDYDQMATIASYGGFPHRYPHWRWGMEYEEMSRGFEFSQYRIFEMVINANPCVIYNLSSNTLVDHVTVIAHATAHNHFFKNNRLFGPTNTNMINEFASHRTRVKQHMSEWGGELVQKFLDKVLSLEPLIDPADAYEKRKYERVDVWQKRKHIDPLRIKIDPSKSHMEDWINKPEWIEEQKKKIKQRELANYVGIMTSPERNIFKFLKDNAPLRPWQQDVMSIVYDETMYFAPQRFTKVGNEGLASWADSQIMARMGLAGDDGIYDYALHKSGVLGGPNSTNPYKLGYSLLMDIEERWDKGRFGFEYDECRDVQKKQNWDTKVGLGHEKVFEVCALYDDIQLISEFFTEEFCHKNQFYEKKQLPDGSWEIVSRDVERIKKLMIRSKINGGFPDVRIVEHNFRDRRILVLKHYFDGRRLHRGMSSEAMQAICGIWGSPVMLLTQDGEGNEFCLYAQDSTSKVITTIPEKI